MFRDPPQVGVRTRAGAQTGARTDGTADAETEPEVEQTTGSSRGEELAVEEAPGEGKDVWSPAAVESSWWEVRSKRVNG